MSAEYTYRVSAWWTSGRTGLAKCESSPNTIHFSEAAELGGLQGRWTPEQLLLCALAGCFTTTFHDIARSAKFEYTDLEVEIEGSVRRTRGAGCSFNEILIRPRLTVHSEDQCEAGLTLLRRAKSVCMISRAITVPQTLEPLVETVKLPVEGWTVQDTAVKIGV
ncbi:MAG: OsmC family protein [Candidatus Sulfotelmatobacter sp.]